MLSVFFFDISCSGRLEKRFWGPLEGSGVGLGGVRGGCWEALEAPWGVSEGLGELWEGLGEASTETWESCRPPQEAPEGSPEADRVLAEEGLDR